MLSFWNVFIIIVVAVVVFAAYKGFDKKAKDLASAVARARDAAPPPQKQQAAPRPGSADLTQCKVCGVYVDPNGGSCARNDCPF